MTHRLNLVLFAAAVLLLLWLLGAASATVADGTGYPTTNASWTRLATGQHGHGEPHWSPDGSHIAWTLWSNSLRLLGA